MTACTPQISRRFFQTIVTRIAFVALLIFAAFTAAQTQAQFLENNDSVFSLQSELLLEVLLEGRSLNITVLAYRRDEQVYVALGEFMDAIRFPVNTDAESGQAGGWYIEEEREFLLDLNQPVVISGGNRFIPGDEVAVFEGRIFVSLDALETWFPLRLEALIRQLALNVEPRETIPLQTSMQRRNRRVFGAGAITREPELPFQETPYGIVGPHSTDLRVNTSSVLTDEEDETTDLQGSYSLLSRGDLAWMTSTVAITGSDRDELTSGRLKLERNLDRPFLELDYVELGDVDAGSRGVLVRGGGAERGVEGTFTGESIDLRGDVPPGWEVELYRNGILIDVQVVGDDAQYEFLNVPLEFGENRFEFFLYGPFGEERRDERTVFAGDGLEFGNISYTLSAVQDGKSVFDGIEANSRDVEGAGRYRASFNLGLGARTSARLSVDSFEQEGERLENASLGLSKSFSRAQTSLGYNRRERDLDSVTGLIRGRVGEDSRASFQYTRFLATDLEPNFMPENPLLWSAGASLSSKIFNNPFSIDASRSESEIGSGSLINFGTTIPTPWFRLSKSLFYNHQDTGSETNEQSGGSFSFSYDHQPWRFRSGGTYNISPESNLTNVFGSANIQLERRMRLNFDIRHRPDDNYTNYRMGFSWGLEYVQISPQVIYDTNKRWVGLVSLSTSFNPRPNRYLPAFDRLSQSGFGAAHVRAFLDDNGDGVWNSGEEELGDVRVDAIQSYQETLTAQDGNGYLTRLRSGRVTDIAIDPSSLPAFDLNATSPGVSIRPRPGSWSTVDFPVVRTMELEGYVYLARPDGQPPTPAGRVLVQLRDSSGEIVSQQRTVFDGFYLFSNVAPGTYDLVLKDEFENRLVERPGQVTVTSEGGVIRNLNFTIAAASRYLMGTSDQAEDGNSEGPRIIAPVVPQDDEVTSEPLPEELPVATPASASTPAAGVSERATKQEAPAPENSRPSGDWHVQFGAFGIEENATRRWNQLQAANVLPADQQPRYEDTGNLVRLLTGNGVSEEAARALCDQVKAAGAGDCLVRQLEN